MNNIPHSQLLKRGVAEIVIETELLELLSKEKPLRLKMGFDPSAPDLHLGHAVGLRKLRQFQELGHKVVVIVGDWTAQIGDPSGQSLTRPILTTEEVYANADTYLQQFFKIVDKEKTEIRWQKQWFGNFGLTEIINLTNNFTVAQFLAREDFSKRMKFKQPITITELLYPLLQAYDSVAVKSDIELGGTDQKFNLLVGRDLQHMMGMQPQQLVMVPILVGTDGVKKMSKSLGNYIALDDRPTEMFGKTMSLPDEAILPYLENLTDLPTKDIEEIDQSIKSQSVNPMEMKKLLAKELVTQFHDSVSAIDAETHFEFTVQRRKLPEDIETYKLSTTDKLTTKRLSEILVDTKMASSSSEARRLINQGAVRVNEKTVSLNTQIFLSENDIIRVGRRRFLKIVTT